WRRARRGARADRAARRRRRRTAPPGAVMTESEVVSKESHRGGWRLMGDVSRGSSRWIVLGVFMALGWTIGKIAIPLLALEAINRGIDPYNGGELLKLSL